MALKDGLQSSIRAGEAREAAELYPLVDDQPAELPDRWTVKDHVAHLSAWREHAIAVVDAARTGSAPAPSVDDLDRTNAAIHARVKDVLAAEVIQSAKGSWVALDRAVAICPEAVLRSPRPNHPESEAWTVVPPNAHGHLAEHLGYLAMERGDVSAAEAAARWAHDIDVQAFPNTSFRADADYNLGCFYSRLGRAVEALPLFSSAFRLKPSLKQWAQQDQDLDPVRDRPDIKRLLDS